MRFPRLLKTLVLLAIASLTVCAQAHEHYFAYTYDWFTPFRFEREVEFYLTSFEGGIQKSQLEFEYGVTDRYVVAPYLIFERSGGVTKFNGWKLEQRYRLGERAYGKLMPALYLEVEKENDERNYELEGKLIGTYLPNRNWVISGNLIFGREMTAGAKTETGYALGVARKLSPDQHVGFEAVGNWDTKEHFIGPSFGFGKPSGLKVIGTAGIPIAGGGPFQFRVVLEHEF